MDSLLTISITNAFESDLGPLSSTLLFENPSIDTLAAYFLKNHEKKLSDILRMQSQRPQPLIFDKNRQTLTKEIVRNKPAIIKADHQDIAIIGVHGRYPQANTLDEFWSN